MSSFQAKLLLLSVFVARGTSFLFSKYLMHTMTPETILAVRFLISFAVLAAVFYKKLIACSREDVKGGILLGVTYSICMFFEMYGLRLVDSGVSSFIENMAIVLVPIYTSILTRTLPERKTVICCLLAVAGVGFLSYSQMSGKLNIGVILVILAALTYGVCIIMTKEVSRKGDPLTIGMLQLGIMGAIFLLMSLLSGEFRLPSTGSEWSMILMLAIVCSCFGFAFQPLAQKYLPAETAAVFTVMNPLTASVMGVVIAGEKLDLFVLTGYILIIIALLQYNLSNHEDESKPEEESKPDVV